MVISPDIFNNLVLNKDYSDPKDMEYLITLCQAYPNFKLPYILLLNYEPDFYHREFWKKGEEFIMNSKNNLNPYLGKETVEEWVNLTKNKSNNLEETIDPKDILKQYLSKDVPKFI